MPVMDAFTRLHLAAWLDNQYDAGIVETGEEGRVYSARARAESMIRAMVMEYPELLETHSWSEIRALAERNATL